MIARAIQRTVQAAFWLLAGCLACIVISVPAILNKLIFGSPF